MNKLSWVFLVVSIVCLLVSVTSVSIGVSMGYRAESTVTKGEMKNVKYEQVIVPSLKGQVDVLTGYLNRMQRASNNKGSMLKIKEISGEYAVYKKILNKDIDITGSGFDLSGDSSH